MEKHWKVLITRDIPQVGVDILKKHCEVDTNTEDIPLSKSEIIDKLRGKQALCCIGTEMIDDEIISSEPSLKVIANYAVGYNNIDVEVATKKGIMVTNTPGVLTEAVAEMSWCLLLCVARRVIEADSFVRAGNFKGGGPKLFLGAEVKGKTLGIIGAGRIGTEVAKKSRVFNMRVLYYDLVENEEMKKIGGKRVELEYLLKESDFISLHVPLTSKTRHLIGEKELGLMKKTAYLINTSRGAVIDEIALVKALKKGKIAGAALDVYENEPEITEGLSDMKNVVLTPHIGSATKEAREKMAIMMAENCIAALKGEIPPNLVNPEVLKK
ncbi:D-glycerate dehydrogenase [Candidatus Aerophobetes bacterium]|nr:D-glycerate dehydrogenase [Candidatus Aerophobetes bacterium]